MGQCLKSRVLCAPARGRRELFSFWMVTISLSSGPSKSLKHGSLILRGIDVIRTNEARTLRTSRIRPNLLNRHVAKILISALGRSMSVMRDGTDSQWARRHFSSLTRSGQWRVDGRPYSLVSSMPCLVSYLGKIYEGQQMLSRTIFAIILTLQCLTTRAGAVALISVDASNCREFTAVEKNKLAPYDRTASWIFGFLSGVATASDRDVLRGLDPTAIVDWISNYCRQNPNDSLDITTAKLFQALTTRK